jgi:class 3 adenylate cyclase
MRVVIGLGDVATQDAGELIGETLAFVARIEDITPADEIYLTLAARLALKQSEIQTALVDSFPLKGFAEPVPVYVSRSVTALRLFPTRIYFSWTCAVSRGSPKPRRRPP